MKVVLVAVAVASVLGAGGLAGAAMSPEDPSAPTGVAEDEQPPARHAAQRTFVTEKRKWTACVAEAAPAHEAGSGPFDPEVACGDKPHPHDERGPRGNSADARKDHDDGHGRPAWAGGPDRRTAEPPGHSARDRAAGRR